MMDESSKDPAEKGIVSFIKEQAQAEGGLANIFSQETMDLAKAIESMPKEQRDVVEQVQKKFQELLNITLATEVNKRTPEAPIVILAGITIVTMLFRDGIDFAKRNRDAIVNIRRESSVDATDDLV